MASNLNKIDLIIVLSLLLLFSTCSSGDNYPDYSRGNPYERARADQDYSARDFGRNGQVADPGSR